MDLGPCVSDITGLVFEGCTSLESINVNADNENYCCVDGAVYTKDMTSIIACPGGKSGEFVIPDGVKSIGKYAFKLLVSAKKSILFRNV